MDQIGRKLDQFDSVVIWYNEPYLALVIQATRQYIPMAEFVEVFHRCAEYVQQYKVDKAIFDKSRLRTFHQPSMVWYHLFWKVEVAKMGLTKHRKILPDDRLFCDAVSLARKKLAETHPNFHFEDYDIRYVDSILQGLEV